MLYVISLKLIIEIFTTCSCKTRFIMEISISEAIEKLKDVGLNVYTPKTKDSGFIKVYKNPIVKVLPDLSGNALKVLIALSSELKWNEPEIVLTRQQIEKLTGLTKDTVRTGLDELEEKMIIKRLGPNVRRSYVISNCYVKIGKNK